MRPLTFTTTAFSSLVDSIVMVGSANFGYSITTTHPSETVARPRAIICEDDVEKLRPRVRFRVAQQVGWVCADLDDIVQETLARFLVAVRQDKLHSPAAVGAFLNSICRNVIFEYRRRLMRDGVMPEIIPDPSDKRLSGAEQLEIRDAITQGLAQLSSRDRQILRAFYIEEKTKEEILALTGLSYEQFRVVLCRAKERFRTSYNARLQQARGQRHL
jgi:RNA polymerase sigma-70 factor (ECF subfamily)